MAPGTFLYELSKKLPFHCNLLSGADLFIRPIIRKGNSSKWFDPYMQIFRADTERSGMDESYSLENSRSLGVKLGTHFSFVVPHIDFRVIVAGNNFNFQ